MSTQQPEDPRDPSGGWYVILLAGALISSVSIAFFVEGGIGDLERLQKKKKKLKTAHRNLQKKHKELKLRRKRLQQDPHLIENLARERLGMVKPGEKRIKFDSSVRTPSSAGDSGVRFDTSAVRVPSFVPESRPSD
ncbi:MAG: septum formation initiator family protein [bacterium]